jgi:tetratricopeptide (TPR) repeat protein
LLVAATGTQAQAPLGQHKELVRLDALLAGGDTAAADALLKGMGAQLAKDDRLAFDTIYVLVSRDRMPDARAQWNALAPRVQKRLEAVGASPSDDDRRLLGEAMFTQGVLTARGGDGQEALRLLQQADGLGFPPLDSPLMLLAAGALVEVQAYDLAVSAYREFLKTQPANLVGRAALGEALFRAGRMVDAQKELEVVIGGAPKTPRANYVLGAVLFHLKDFDRASMHLERELAIDPRCAPCLSTLSHIAYLKGDEALCQAWLDKAKAVDPASVEVQFVSGALALRQERYEVAIALLLDVVSRVPDYATARFQLATAYRRAGQMDKAREQLDAYQRLLDEQKKRETGVRGSGEGHQ